MTFAKMSFLLPVIALVAACATAPLTLNDDLVVPGERVGEVEIGMSLAQLLALKGVPRKTIPIEGTAATTYFFEGLTVAADDEVYWIIAKDRRFRTASGVAPGVEQIYARASFGKPNCVVSKGPQTVYDYGNFYFGIDNASGIVEHLGVQKRTHTCRK